MRGSDRAGSARLARRAAGPTSRARSATSTPSAARPGPTAPIRPDRFFGVDRISRGTTERQRVGVRLVHPWTGPASRVRQRVEFDTADYDLSFLSAFGLVGVGHAPHARAHSDRRRARRRRRRLGRRRVAVARAHAARSSRRGGADVPVDRRVIGTFGEARWNAHERVSVQAGLRAEHITREAFIVNGFCRRSPSCRSTRRCRSSWLVSRRCPATARGMDTLRAAAGTGIRPPDVFEIAFTDNPELEAGAQPQRRGSASRRRWPAGALQLDATTFFNRYDDLIISVGSLQRRQPLSHRQRLERARARPRAGRRLAGPSPACSVRASYTFLDTEIRAVDNSAQAPSPYHVGDPLLRRPRHSGSLIVDWTARRGRRCSRRSTRAARRSTPSRRSGRAAGSTRTPAARLVDLGGALRADRAASRSSRASSTCSIATTRKCSATPRLAEPRSSESALLRADDVSFCVLDAGTAGLPRRCPGSSTACPRRCRSGAILGILGPERIGQDDAAAAAERHAPADRRARCCSTARRSVDCRAGRSRSASPSCRRKRSWRSTTR